MNVGIVVCSRLGSERLPQKVLRNINGVSLLWHLMQRLDQLGLQLILAVPDNEAVNYAKYTSFKNVHVLGDPFHHADPLGRMCAAAKSYDLDAVIRVTHDKIFVDPIDVKNMLDHFIKNKLDYVYSTSFVPGTGFEIISTDALEKAAAKFKNIEFIGFAIKQVTDKLFNFPINDKNRNGKRLLIDFPEDLQLMELLFSKLGNNATKKEACDFLDANEEFMQINHHPLVSVYTCALNAEKWIKQSMDSVKMQNEWKRIEYILIDDFSSDSTFEQMMRFSLDNKNVKVVRNDRNIGLASSSNKALKMARGKYIVRLDADDYFTRNDAIKQLVTRIEIVNSEVVYPDNYIGTIRHIQKGNEHHHVGGALFHRDAINHLQFSEGLRHHDSLDIFIKARDFLKIGYLDRAMFLYRQHDGSLSKSNVREREKIKNRLLAERQRREFASN